MLLSALSTAVWLTPDKTYSSSERRMLAERPAVTKESILKGSFQEDFETYLCEQIPWRTRWVSLQSGLSRLLGNRDVNGVYFGKDGYLLERYQIQEYDFKQVRKNIRRVAAFVKKYPQAKVMFVPVKSSVLAGKLPAFAQISGEEQFYELVKQQIPKEQQIEVSQLLRAHDSEYIYYRTDHHWTSLGAFYAYEAWAEDMGFTPLQKDDFKIYPADTSFLGTTFAKTRTGGKADTITLYERKNGPAFTLDYNMGEFQTDSFFDLSKLQGDDPYSVFLGGNQALIDGKTDTAEDGKTLLIIKDSFGNCFAPFAASHYARTIIADLRYINIPVHALLQMYPADDILILYNSAQFMDDKDVLKLK